MLHSPEIWGGADVMSVLGRQQAMMKFLQQQTKSVELGSDQYRGSIGSSFQVAGQPQENAADHGGSWNSGRPKEEGGDTVLIEKNNSNKRKSVAVAGENCKQKRSKAKSSPENSSNCTSKENSKASEVQKPNYIHVRARRGQATDSHSLAERARREKIGRKMKCLQDLVPGCHKVTGKAGMLDEIINYVQSLQKQVEFLSMKLAAVNPGMEFKTNLNFPANFAGMASLQHLLSQQQGALNCLMDFPLLPAQVTAEGSITEVQHFSTWNGDLQGLYSENNMGFQ